jgi:tryptophan synthase
MGTTGATAVVDSNLPTLLQRINSHLPSPIPLAVGFGVSTRSHFEQVGELADGVVIGSKFVDVVKRAKEDEATAAIRKFCEEISGDRKPRSLKLGGEVKATGELLNILLSAVLLEANFI